MLIRPAIVEDCPKIAELCNIAGAGIPAYLWGLLARPGQSAMEAGVARLSRVQGNTSYRNVLVATLDDAVAGMALSYRLPGEPEEDPVPMPDFIQPMVELEHTIPGHFFIDMLAVYPQYRNHKLGSALVQDMDGLAQRAQCRHISLEVFEQNAGALRLYRQLGFEISDRRKTLPHPCYPYEGNVLLMTRPVGGQAAP